MQGASLPPTLARSVQLSTVTTKQEMMLWLPSKAPCPPSQGSQVTAGKRTRLRSKPKSGSLPSLTPNWKAAKLVSGKRGAPTPRKHPRKSRLVGKGACYTQVGEEKEMHLQAAGKQMAGTEAESCPCCCYNAVTCPRGQQALLTRGGTKGTEQVPEALHAKHPCKG